MGLCQMRALRIDVVRTAQWHGSDQLFVCFGGTSKGSAVTKLRMSHSIVEAISLAYESHGLTSPLGLRAHSTSSSFFSGRGWLQAPVSYSLEQTLSLVSSYLRYVRCYGITFPKR